MRKKRELTGMSKHATSSSWKFVLNDCTCGKQPHIEECEHSKGAWVICTCRRESKFVYDRKTQYQCLAETVEDWNAMNPIEEKKEQTPTLYGEQMESAAMAYSNAVAAMEQWKLVVCHTKNPVVVGIGRAILTAMEQANRYLTDDIRQIREAERAEKEGKWQATIK